MFDHRHYVSILKGRMGEYKALETLAPDVRSALTPLIEIPAIPWDYENDIAAKTIDAHTEKVAANLRMASGPNGQRPVFVDGYWIDDAPALADGRHALRRIFDEGQARGLRLIPVTALDRPASYQQAVRGIIDADGRGYCLRLSVEDLQGLPNLPALIQGVGLPNAPAAIDLLLDLKELPEGQRPTVVAGLRSLLPGLADAAAWRSLTVAGTGFPRDLRLLDAWTYQEVPRTEYLLWDDLVTGNPALRRLPTFGDYAIQHPEQVEVDPRFIRMSANLRYTLDTSWLLVKGESTRGQAGYGQFASICQWLQGQGQFRGGDFSAADNQIRRIASGEATPGNATTWRQIGTNHHLTVVVRQLASRFGA